MANVLKLDCATNSASMERNLGANYAEVWVDVDWACNATYLTALHAAVILQEYFQFFESGYGSLEEVTIYPNSGTPAWTGFPAAPATPFVPGSALTSLQFYRVRIHLTAGSPIAMTVAVDGVDIGAFVVTGVNLANIRYLDITANGMAVPGGFVYMDNLKIGTTAGGTDIYSDDFEGTLGGFTFVSGSMSIVADPGIAAPVDHTPPLPPSQRVGIAFDDGPLEPDPIFTFIDGTENLVAGYDIVTGKQTQLDRTDTGTATVYLHDTTGDFDPNNVSSPYFGKLVGKQILLQLFDPVTSTWEKQWLGKIRDYNYDIVGVLGNDDKPIVANIQIECVDIFDYLGGYGLQPGIDGDTPPAGQEGIVFYEDTAGTVDDRHIQILTACGIDSTRYVVFTGNVKVQETKYDPGDAALVALRDAADAEGPFLSNIYVDRFGRYAFHGFYSRTDPDTVSASAGDAAWDFQRWKVGDGTAITGDSDYAQIRVLAYAYGESDVINSAVSWPAGMIDSEMPGQVFEDATSITAHGKCSLPPMGNLIISDCPTTMNTPKVQCQKYAEFFVHYRKDAAPRITALMVKAIQPDDPRATSTWAVLTRADISDAMYTKVGYPGATGIDMDNYIEGYTKRVRPLNPDYDYVEVEFNLTPTAWALDPDGILAPAS